MLNTVTENNKITREQNINDMQINITSTKLVTEKGHLGRRETKHLTRNYETTTNNDNNNTNSCAYIQNIRYIFLKEITFK